MIWDYAESNPFLAVPATGIRPASTGSLEWSEISTPLSAGSSVQAAAQVQHISDNKVVSHGSPVLQTTLVMQSLRTISMPGFVPDLKVHLPGLFATISTPKSEESVASTARHESKEAAESFFLDELPVR